MLFSVIKKVLLQQHHFNTGKVRHYVLGSIAPDPKELRIVSYQNDPGYYLLYIDAKGKEITDTYHDTIEAAIKQAEFEFNVKKNEWELV